MRRGGPQGTLASADAHFLLLWQVLDGASLEPKEPPKVKRRVRIPDKPNYSLNLWSIMKNCIGRELSKIPMPVGAGQGSFTGFPGSVSLCIEAPAALGVLFLMKPEEHVMNYQIVFISTVAIPPKSRRWALGRVSALIRDVGTPFRPALGTSTPNGASPYPGSLTGDGEWQDRAVCAQGGPLYQELSWCPPQRDHAAA